MTTSTSELRRLAEAATPGPWRTGSVESYNGRTGEPEAFVYRLPEGKNAETAHNRICVRSVGDGDCDADAAYIAAALPDRILALLDERDRLRDGITKFLSLYDQVETFDPYKSTSASTAYDDLAYLRRQLAAARALLTETAALP